MNNKELRITEPNHGRNQSKRLLKEKGIINKWNKQTT